MTIICQQKTDVCLWFTTHDSKNAKQNFKKRCKELEDGGKEGNKEKLALS